MGKYHAVHDLTEGLILLFQQRCAEACALLMQTEMALKTTGMKLQQIQANLLLAACHLEQDQVPEMLRRLEEVGAILSTYECYAQRVSIELRHLPALAQAIKTLPAAANVRALLHLERQEQAQNAVVASSALPASVPAQVIASEEPPRLRILAFGEPVVFLDEQPVVGWRMARALELFFYLLDAGRRPLAISVMYDNLYVYGPVVKDAARTASVLAPVLEMPEREILSKIDRATANTPASSSATPYAP